MGKVNADRNLFKYELDVLESVMADIDNKKNLSNELLPRYKLLADNYRRLLTLTRKLIRISDRQGQVLQVRQDELQSLLDNANQGFLTFGPDLKVNRQYSAECARIFGGKIAGMKITGLLSSVENICIHLFTGELERLFSPDGGKKSGYFPRVFRINGMDVRVECKVIDSRIMMILTDITEKLKVEEQINYLSYHDKLTSLYNRAYVDKVLQDMKMPQSLPLSVIMADMNGLKLVNDVFGHGQGDLLLVAMANALRSSCRQGSDIIARWGGDEFLVLLPNTDESSCRMICQRIRRACGEAGDNPIPLSAAIGSATSDDICDIPELFRVAEKLMYNNKQLESKEVRKSIVAAMEAALRTGCFESPGHSLRVYRMAVDFAHYLGVDTEGAEMRPLRQLAALHDIGKVVIPKEILGKAGPLNQGEWMAVKSHSDAGYRMARSIGELELAEVILAHHERWDGEGYPYGLKGDKIPFLARLFSLVDVYDTITHDRPYGSAMGREEALREIESCGSTQFDGELTRLFLSFMAGRK